MDFWIGRIYEAIVGTPAPSVPAVRRAIGGGAPCEASLRAWRKGHRLPSEADVFRLLLVADRTSPGFSRDHETAIAYAWWGASRKRWAGVPVETGEVSSG